MLGLSGSHRTGKTTLAKALGMPVICTQTSAVFARHGLSARDNLSASQRDFIQWEILNDAIKLWESAPKGFVSDRTPLDMIVYANASPDSDYYRQCIGYTQQFFKTVIIIQPAIPIVDDPTKAITNCDEFNKKIIAVGAVVNAVVLPQNVLSVDKRTVWVLCHLTHFS